MDTRDQEISRLEKIIEFQFKDRTRAMTEIMEILRELQVESEKMRAALQSIAALDIPDAINPNFWDKSDIHDIAETIAEDTRTARKALSQEN